MSLVYKQTNTFVSFCIYSLTLRWFWNAIIHEIYVICTGHENILGQHCDIFFDLTMLHPVVYKLYLVCLSYSFDIPQKPCVTIIKSKHTIKAQSSLRSISIMYEIDLDNMLLLLLICLLWLNISADINTQATFYSIFH